MTIGPWAALLIYDLILYIVRAFTYEIPVIGGRARGKARPRAPSLTERPSGRRRRFSLAQRSADVPVLASNGDRASEKDVRHRQIAKEKEDTT